MQAKAPCKDCKDRREGCHGKADEEKAFIRKKKEKEKLLNNYEIVRSHCIKKRGMWAK